MYRCRTNGRFDMPTFKELKRFCENDDWELFKDTDHEYYRKLLPDGTYKRTKVSRNPKEISPTLFKRILKQQLRVSKEYFNSKI